MHGRYNKFIVRTLTLLIASVFSQAYAAGEVLEEVVITAQKRTERLQDVPLSASVIGGNQLETRGIEGPADLNGLAPNVVVKSAQPGANLMGIAAIRGVGNGHPSIWSDGSVGLYLDGIYIGKNQGALLDMVDLERIEILRGPQGTLFGKNTEGGAINFITRKPSGEFSGNVGVELGNYGHHVERVSLDLPRLGVMRLGVSLRDEKRDGITDNPNGQKWDDRNRQAQRISAGFDITPDFKVDYAYDHSHIDEVPPATSLISNTGYARLYPTQAVLNGLFGLKLRPAITPYVNAGYPDSVTSDPGGNFYTKMDVNGQSITASYKLDPTNTLKYIGSLRKMHYQERIDLDGTPEPVLVVGKNTHYDTTSHELQWVGNTERMNYVLGYYLFTDDGNTLAMQSGSFYTFGFQGSLYKQPYYRTQSDARALYGQIDYKLTSELTGTLGLRRTLETRWGDIWRTDTNANFDQIGSPGVTYQPGFAPQGTKAGFASTTPVLALSYKLKEGMSVFGRIAKGFKSGGFDLEATTAAESLTPYLPETSVSYEMGLKTASPDGKVQFNATVFRTDIRQMQLGITQPDGIDTTTQNVGKVQSQGLELDGAIQIADGWRLQLSYGFLDAKFKEYLSPNQYGASVDIASNTVVPFAPRHQLSLSLDGRLARTSYGTLRGIVDYVYTSEFYNYTAETSARVANAGVQNSADESLMPSQAIVNARLLLAGIPLGGPGKSDASLWVRNLTNVKKEASHIDVGGFYRVAGWTEPRTFGVSGNYKW
jgi:iron complex outermembrane receptor protein